MTTQFKEGDKVRYDSKGCHKDFDGLEMTVTSTTPGGVKGKSLNGNFAGYPVGHEFHLSTEYIKLIEEPPTLKVGDKVVVEKDFPTHTWSGTEGIITALRGRDYALVKVTKAGPNNAKYVKIGNEYNLSDLTLIEEKPFTFKDIQVGDTIRRTLIRESGAKEVREGTVSKIASWYAEDDGYILAYDTDKDVTLELLNRPEPEPVKEAWESAKAGDRLVVKAANGATRVLTKLKSGDWGTLVITASGSHTGLTRSDEYLKEQLASKSYNVDGEHKFYAL